MIGEALRLLRVYHDLSQTELAAALEMSKSFLSEIESEKKQPTLELLERYSRVFEIPVSSLVFFAERIDGKEAGKNVRHSIARKVVSLLNWVEEKSSGNVAKRKST